MPRNAIASHHHADEFKAKDWRKVLRNAEIKYSKESIKYPIENKNDNELSMLPINIRIAFLIDYFAKGRQIDFAEETGIPQATLQGIIGKRQSEPGFGILNKIVATYPNVNAYWLLNGQGEPFNANSNTETIADLSIEKKAQSSENDTIKNLTSEISWLRTTLNQALRIIENAGLGKLKVSPLVQRLLLIFQDWGAISGTPA